MCELERRMLELFSSSPEGSSGVVNYDTYDEENKIFEEYVVANIDLSPQKEVQVITHLYDPYLGATPPIPEDELPPNIIMEYTPEQIKELGTTPSGCVGVYYNDGKMNVYETKTQRFHTKDEMLLFIDNISTDEEIMCSSIRYRIDTGEHVMQFGIIPKVDNKFTLSVSRIMR